jgi:D-glycero-D-manno-heptose 1,7-bisphosphate phosphatase
VSAPGLQASAPQGNPGGVETEVPAPTARRAVFLDRDGVILKLLGSGPIPRAPRSVQEVELVEGAEVALERLRTAGFVTLTVTNQPDIARGEVDERAVQEIHRMLRSRLPLDAVYYCPHDNAHQCACRKPKPGLILRAAEEWGIDLSRSCLIGDRWVDLAAAQAAGIDGILLETPDSWHPTSVGSPAKGIVSRFTGRTLISCVEFVLSSGRYR